MNVSRRIATFLGAFILFTSSFHLLGILDHAFEIPFSSYIQTVDGRIYSSVESLARNDQSELVPCCNIQLNLTKKTECFSNEPVNLVIIVKSAMEHFTLRMAVRDTWGGDRIYGISSRTVFLLGKRTGDSSLESAVARESEIYGDIVQSDFEDTYFNNTLKSLSGIQWAFTDCNRDIPFYLFVDDDMLVSIKNLRNLIWKKRHIQDLYLGYVFNSSPMRQRFSKWYIPVHEYPYDSWPPYVTAGAYLLNRKTLEKFYFATWFTDFFRFDDIYISFLALHTRVSPIHSSDIYFWKKPYSVPEDYRSVVASHGYDNPAELIKVWREMKAVGFA